ncbi:phage minor capsid protein [Bacillus sp. JJ1503]|uniref:phage minor capsid protein n=1 Tax=Bacillus sp. JJ1503 TaxID=3122956 RepID=UPI002FFD5F69
MLFPPPPNYDYDAKKLVRYYEKAIDDILRELERIDLTNFQRANAIATLGSISEILQDLDGKAAAWATVAITKAVTDGVVRSMITLGVADNVQQAQTIVRFNRINRELVKAATADTQADLLAVTKNVDRKVRAAVRQVTAEVFRANLPKGINATQSLRRDITAGLRKQLGESVNTGIIDAAGRRWKPVTYADMLVRTKMMEAHKEATVNEAIAQEAYYGVISRHGAKDACRTWEGRIIKLDRNAPGNYPYLYDLPRNEIFHPYCRHVITPVRVIDYLPDDIKALNDL